MQIIRSVATEFQRNSEVRVPDFGDRKRLVKTAKYLLFDVGVRRVSAKLGIKLPEETMGHLFEEFVGLELLRILRNHSPFARLLFWRDFNGPEVDWVVEKRGEYLPFEVKWSSKPTPSDCKYLHVFMGEYPAHKGYIVCRIPYRQKMSSRVDAIPWQDIPEVMSEFFSSDN